MTDDLTTLTPQWLTYCAEFARSLNVQVARDVSYLTVNNIKHHANDPLVLAEVARNMHRINEIANVDKAMVLAKLYDFTESDLIDIYDANGEFLPLHHWPKVMRQMIVSFEIDPESGRPCKVKFIDRLKVLALLGKHVDVGAFEEKVSVTHDLSERLAKRLGAARKRIAIEGTVTYDE